MVPGGCLLLGGVSAPRVVSALGGGCSWGVSAWGGLGVSAPHGGCLLWGVGGGPRVRGVCSGGWYPSMH